MDSFRQFVRYVGPGLIFFSELAILAFVANPKIVASSAAGLEGFNLGQPLAVLILAGGVGAIASSIYHAIARFIRPIDHREVVKKLRAAKILYLFEQGESEVSVQEEINIDGAWRIVTALWHSRLSGEERWKEATKGSEQFFDTAHGAGTALVASVGAAAAAAILAWQNPDFKTTWPFGVIAATVLLICHWKGFALTRMHAQGCVDLMFYEEMRSQQCPIAFAVMEADKVPNDKTWSNLGIALLGIIIVPALLLAGFAGGLVARFQTDEPQPNISDAIRKELDKRDHRINDIRERTDGKLRRLLREQGE